MSALPTTLQVTGRFVSTHEFCVRLDSTTHGCDLFDADGGWIILS